MRIASLVAALVAATLLPLSAALSEPDARPGRAVTFGEPFAGYTLIAPSGSTNSYLVDMEGRVVNAWKSRYRPGQSAYLLPNGRLLRTASLGRRSGGFRAGGAGGKVQELDWDGGLVWEYEYSGEDRLLHHDIERLPNGNVLMIAWEAKSRAEAVKAGRDPMGVGSDGLWADHFIEVRPTGKTTGEIVWEWHAWDHLVQDRFADRRNHGSVEEHPELIDLNPPDWSHRLPAPEFDRLKGLGYLGPATTRRSNPDWMHTNSIAYDPGSDQILLSVLGYSEIWVIDHSTTTEEAAGHAGGKGGRGGDLLYRWGNPQVFDRGRREDRKLFAQHDACWIPSGLPGAGNILLFNNGRGRPDGDWSSVDEISPPVDGDGGYRLEPGKAWGPAEPIWSYRAERKGSFFSGHISGAQRLPNGNTLVCAGESGLVFEVTPGADVVWRFVNPVVAERPGPPGRSARPGGRRGEGGPGPRGPRNELFRAYRYGVDYPAFADRDLTPKGSIEEFEARRADGSEGPARGD